MAMENAKASAAVVVDPYSSGRFLVYELAKREVPIICVRSTLQLGTYFLKVYDSHKQYYVETINYEDMGSVELLVQRLESLPYEVCAVFGGSEPGVELAELLSEALKLPAANGTELLHARKDKAAMQDQLRACGVPAADQFKSGDLDELLQWASARDQWPLVAKPIRGSSSEGVYFCQGEEDLINAHTEIVGALNPNGIINTHIALQEFLQGDEYIVDTVSFEGKHLCVAVWVYKKQRGLPWNPTAIISTQNTLLPASGEQQDQLVSYVFDVLDAVGLRYGPCHTEVMFTPRGLILVEVNARMHGLQGPRLIELSTGISKATYTADAILAGGELFKELYVPPPGRYLYPVNKHCVQLVLISSVKGYLKTSIKDAIMEMELPSIVEILPATQKGQYLVQSCDLTTCAGQVLMVHESEEQIEHDIHCIREAEEKGKIYEVSDTPLQSSPVTRPSDAPSFPQLKSLEKAEEALMPEQDLLLAEPDPVVPELTIVGLDQ